MTIDKQVIARPEIAVSRAAFLDRPRANQWGLAQIFFNVNMAKQHYGLKELAVAYGIDLEKLEPGQFVAFFNRKRTKVKLFTAGNTFIYAALDEGQFTADMIGQLPALFRSEAKVQFQPVFLEALESEVPKTHWDKVSEERKAFFEAHAKKRGLNA